MTERPDEVIDSMVKRNMREVTSTANVEVPFHGKFRSTKQKKKKRTFLCDRCRKKFTKLTVAGQTVRCPDCLTKEVTPLGVVHTI